jgi:hypothetical protein
MIRLLLIVTMLACSWGFADDGATYLAAEDKVIETNSQGNLPVELHEVLAAIQIEKWARVEEQTGHEMGYSYNLICDAENNCMKVDPPSRINR